jgi:hypothetical protein
MPCRYLFFFINSQATALLYTKTEMGHGFYTPFGIQGERSLRSASLAFFGLHLIILAVRSGETVMLCRLIAYKVLVYMYDKVSFLFSFSFSFFFFFFLLPKFLLL